MHAHDPHRSRRSTRSSRPRSLTITPFVLAVLLCACGPIISCSTTAAVPHASSAPGPGPASTPAGVSVPAGHALALTYHATGVQIYTWNAAASSWGMATPRATLVAGEAVAGIHGEGPSWQQLDGSRIVGAKVAAATVDAQSIPWLLLHVVSTTGSGLFSGIDYVQRHSTHGGLPPAQAGAADGEQRLVPYAADYLFFRLE